MKLLLGGFILLFIIFSSTAFAGETGHGQDAHNNSSIKSIIAPLGIVTLVFLIATLTLGFLMPKNRKKLFPWHRKIAIVTMIVAITHGAFVLIFH